MANLFSKEAQDQLKAFKSTLAKTHDAEPSAADAKPEQAPVLPSKQQIAKQVKRYDSEHLDNDKVLFMQAMAGVTPLKDSNQANTNTRRTAKLDAATLAKRAAAVGTDEDAGHALSDMQALLNPVASEAFLSYKVPTLPSKTFNQLKQGKLTWYDAVDLHGASIDEAREAVSKLIVQARAKHENCVKIVHGKGTDSILKTCVNGWLRQISDVLAFVSAPPAQGGTGAVLVLLKKGDSSDDANHAKGNQRR